MGWFNTDLPFDTLWTSYFIQNRIAWNVCKYYITAHFACIRLSTNLLLCINKSSHERRSNDGGVWRKSHWLAWILRRINPCINLCIILKGVIYFSLLKNNEKIGKRTKNRIGRFILKYKILKCRRKKIKEFFQL